MIARLAVVTGASLMTLSGVALLILTADPAGLVALIAAVAVLVLAGLVHATRRRDVGDCDGLDGLGWRRDHTRPGVTYPPARALVDPDATAVIPRTPYGA